MNNKYALHHDYRKVPVFNIHFKPLQMKLVNAVIGLERFLRCRNPGPGVTRGVCQMTGFDGRPINAVIIAPVEFTRPAPLLLYYHGGAFAMSYASGHIQMCERYARDTGCVVALIDYRLAPQFPFPHGFNDCYDALEWCITNPGLLGIDPSRIAVMGDSAGGAMAAGVAQKAFDRHIALRAQLLVYPVLDCDCKTPSATNFVDTPLWNAPGNRRMWEMYLKNCRGDVPDYAAPGKRGTLTGLAPAYVDTAEFDPLRDEGIAYAQALQAQGVQVRYIATHGTIHGFELARNNPETLRVLDERVDFLKRHL